MCRKHETPEKKKLESHNKENKERRIGLFFLLGSVRLRPSLLGTVFLCAGGETAGRVRIAMESGLRTV